MAGPLGDTRGWGRPDQRSLLALLRSCVRLRLPGPVGGRRCRVQHPQPFAAALPVVPRRRFIWHGVIHRDRLTAGRNCPVARIGTSCQSAGDAGCVPYGRWPIGHLGGPLDWILGVKTARVFGDPDRLSNGRVAVTLHGCWRIRRWSTDTYSQLPSLSLRWSDASGCGR